MKKALRKKLLSSLAKDDNGADEDNAETSDNNNNNSNPKSTFEMRQMKMRESISSISHFLNTFGHALECG